MLNWILVVDFGSQVTQLIARRIREQNIYCEVIPYNKLTINLLNNNKPSGVILSGGPASVNDSHPPLIPNEIFSENIPIYIASNIDDYVTKTISELLPFPFG